MRGSATIVDYRGTWIVPAHTLSTTERVSQTQVVRRR